MKELSNKDFLQAVERVKTRLDKQGAQSKNEHGCAYRGGYRRVCAGGALIKDEFYHPDLEDLYVTHRTVRAAIEKSLGQKLTEQQLAAVVELQAMHDLYWEPQGESYSNLLERKADSGDLANLTRIIHEEGAST